MLTTLIYASVATSHCDATELRGILERARETNARLGLTGMLLHSDGSFLQVLEGEPAVVDQLYEKLARDRRHTRVTQIIRESIPRRYFEDWSMGFSELSHDSLKTISGTNDFFQAGSCFTSLDSGRAKKLLASFAKGRWQANANSALPRKG